MIAVLQRVSKADVSIEGQSVGAIKQGLLVLLGIGEADDRQDADWLVRKILAMRIFNDSQGVMNRSLLEEAGDLLVVSQFTLHASTKKGNRPSYIKAANPDIAIPLYEYFLEKCEFESGKAVARGRFGANMQVSLVNDGPVTIIIDSKHKK